MEVGLGPGDIVLDRGPAFPTERGTVAPSFRPMSIVAKRSPTSATAELLLNYGASIISMEKVKPDSSNSVCSLMVVSTSVCKVDYPQIECIQGRVIFGK